MKTISKIYSYILYTIILLLTSTSFIQSAKFLKENVVAAINCGGLEYIDEDGIVYQKDNFYDGGVSSDHGLNYDISNTKDMELYQTERWHSDTLTYSVPIKAPGKYVIILKFSEVYFNASDEKVFDIAFGKKIVIKDLDVFRHAGKAVAHDEFLEIELKDDKVFVNKSEAPGAYDAKNSLLKIRFLKGSKDNPKINAILVYKGDIVDTDFAEKKKKLDNENRKKLQEAKRSYLIEKKHSQEEVYDEDAALSEDDSVLTIDEPGFINIFFTVHGAYVLISFGMFLLLNYALDTIENSNKDKIKVE